MGNIKLFFGVWLRYGMDSVGCWVKNEKRLVERLPKKEFIIFVCIRMVISCYYYYLLSIAVCILLIYLLLLNIIKCYYYCYL